MPPANGTLDASVTNVEPRWGYLAYLLPFIEGQTVRDAIDPAFNWWQQPTDVLQVTEYSEFKCPSYDALQPVNLSPPGSNDVQDLPLAAHYMGVLGANVDEDPTLGSFCQNQDNPYEMELESGQTSGSSRRGGSTSSQCVGINSGGKIANNGVIVRDREIGFRRIVDGTSKTFLVGETALPLSEPEWQGTRPWWVGSHGDYSYTAKNVRFPINSGARPGPSRNDIGFGSAHPGGCHFRDG